MTWKLFTGALAALALMAGCASTGTGPATGDTASAPAGTGNGGKACNADLAQDAIGQKTSPELVEKYRKQANASKARALRPRDVITMEYDPQRLNLRVDEQDIVISVNCS